MINDKLVLDELTRQTAVFVTLDRWQLRVTREQWEQLGSPSELFITVDTQAPELSAVIEDPDVASPGPWTSHGHVIPGVTVAGPRPVGLLIARCGGTEMCQKCRGEADYLTRVS